LATTEAWQSGHCVYEVGRRSVSLFCPGERSKQKLTLPETSSHESKQGEWKACLQGSILRGSGSQSLAPASPRRGGSSYSAQAEEARQFRFAEKERGGRTHQTDGTSVLRSGKKHSFHFLGQRDELPSSSRTCAGASFGRGRATLGWETPESPKLTSWRSWRSGGRSGSDVGCSSGVQVAFPRVAVFGGERDGRFGDATAVRGEESSESRFEKQRRTTTYTKIF
jgi:hypothetical protein